MQRVDVLAHARSARQADVLIETASRLGCWPDDVLIEGLDPDERLTALVGRTKGKAHRVAVDRAGTVSTRPGRTSTG